MKRMLLLAAALALTTLACFEGEETTPPPKRFEPSSPVNVLKNVEIAFNNRDINLLKAMLSEDFVFYFDPDDVGQHPPGSQYVIPESWSRAEFLKAVANMFAKANQISLSIETAEVGEPAREETEYLAENVPAELLVMVDELNGFIAESTPTFAFESYRTEGGEKYWRLTKWWDRTSDGYDANPGLEPASLGKVLAMYYAI